MRNKKLKIKKTLRTWLLVTYSRHMNQLLSLGVMETMYSGVNICSVELTHMYI